MRSARRILSLLAGLAAAVFAAFALADTVDVGTIARVVYHSSSQVSQTNPPGVTVGVGDVNGDGHPDFAFGDGSVSIGNDVANGAVTVVTAVAAGTTETFDSIGSDGFRITGTPSSRLGTSVAPVGDVNGDGLPDILIGAPSFKPGGSSNPRGAAFLIFGSHTPATVDVGNLAASAGVEIDGATDFGQAGAAVAGIGDLDGGGKPDFAIGVPALAGNRGSVYFVSGETATATLTLGGVGTKEITGESAGDSFGQALAEVGDADGNGKPDVLAGAPGSSAGAAYLIHGESLAAAASPAAVIAIALKWA